MSTRIDQSSGLWLSESEVFPPGVFDLRGDLRERLSKASGHINAAERRLWHETERGLWSARQAQARIGEVWLGLSGAFTELPALERYLKRDVMQARLEAFAVFPKSEALEGAWEEVRAAEAVILDIPFPEITLLDSQRGMLLAGLERQDRYISALRALLSVVETAYSRCFVALRPGQWIHTTSLGMGLDYEVFGCVCAEGETQAKGGVGRVVSVKGLTAWVFLPLVADRCLEKALVGYVLGYSGLKRVDPPRGGLVASASFYWMRRAAGQLENAHRLVRQGGNVHEVRNLLADLLGSVSRAWFSGFAEDGGEVSWEYRFPGELWTQKSIEPLGVADPIARSLRRIERLDMNCASSAMLQMAVILEVLKEAIPRIEEALADNVDIAEGDLMLLDDHAIGRVRRRAGTRVWLELPHGDTREAQLFRDLVQRVS